MDKWVGFGAGCDGCYVFGFNEGFVAVRSHDGWSVHRSSGLWADDVQCPLRDCVLVLLSSVDRHGAEPVVTDELRILMSLMRWLTSGSVYAVAAESVWVPRVGEPVLSIVSALVEEVI